MSSNIHEGIMEAEIEHVIAAELDAQILGVDRDGGKVSASNSQEEDVEFLKAFIVKHQ